MTLCKTNKLKKTISPGQSFTLQSSLSSECPEQIPPFFSFTTFDLFLRRIPLPHEVEHLSAFHVLHLQLTVIQIN